MSGGGRAGAIQSEVLQKQFCRALRRTHNHTDTSSYVNRKRIWYFLYLIAFETFSVFAFEMCMAVTLRNGEAKMLLCNFNAHTERIRIHIYDLFTARTVYYLNERGISLTKGDTPELQLIHLNSKNISSHLSLFTIRCHQLDARSLRIRYSRAEFICFFCFCQRSFVCAYLLKWFA